VTPERDLEARLQWLEKQVALTEAHFTNAFWTALDAAYESILTERTLVCPVCEHTARRADLEVLVDQCRFGGGKLERYRCPICDCVFGPQKYLDLSDAFVFSDCKVIYTRYSEGDSTANELRTFQSLRPAAQGLYLDWGCGGAWSQTINHLRSQGWNVWGFEPAAESAGQFVTNQRESIEVQFDGIFSNNVIEHFRRPLDEFREFQGLLKPGGLMAHSSPCYQYSYTYTRSHTLFLLGKSPQVLAERTGFRVIDQIEDGEYISFVFQRK
jgi:SAM-dependent methyltransferase